MVMKTMIITGGSSGIGRAATALFAAQGWRVYELSRTGQDDVRQGIRHITCDVTDPAQCRAAVTQVVTAEGRLDLLISNAGMGISGPVEFTDIDEARRQMDVNFFGTLNITQAVLPVLRRQHGGRIILVSSVAAVFSIPYQAFYSASKAAINALGLALRNEMREHGVDVCVLLPGDVKTGFTASRSKETRGLVEYPVMRRAVEVMEHDEQHGMTPDKIARRLLDIANSRRTWAFNVSGLPYRLLCLVGKLVPTTFSNWVVGKIYR